MTALALWGLGLAHAQTAVVLPLEQLKGSERHRGLGFAFASVVERDLSLVPAFDVDAPAGLVIEVPLSKKSGVELADAVRTANERDAEWAVTGAWSIDDRALELRFDLVEAASGEIVARGSAKGAATDFVTVEKDALFALLEDMGVTASPGIRRRVLGTVQTESFEAMRWYGRGLQREAEGDLEEALGDFEDATEADPAFSLALRRASATRMALQREASEESDEAVVQRVAILEKALSKTPDEMSLSKRTRKMGQFTELMVRFAILAELGRTCDAKREMEHFLVRNDGRFMKIEGGSKAIRTAAQSLGLGAKLERTEKKILEEDRPSNVVVTAPAVQPGGFVAGGGRRDITLLGMTRECAGRDPFLRQRALEDLRSLVQTMNDLPEQRVKHGTTVAIELDLRITREQALVDGVTEALEEALVDVEARTAELDLKPRERVQNILEGTRDLAAQTSRFHNRLAPLTVDDLHGLVEKAHKSWEPATPLCKALTTPRGWELQLERMDRTFEDGWIEPKEQNLFARAAALPLAGFTLGCVGDNPEPLTDPDAITAWLEASLSQASATDRERCVRGHRETTTVRDKLLAHPEDPALAARAIRTAFQEMIVFGCANQNIDSVPDSPPEPIEED